jgi:nitrite reductase/ring-hydroxylating ferredoxin subunit
LRLACGTAGEIGLHVGSYHVPTGTVVAPPCEVLLRTYQVVLKGDDFFGRRQHARGLY